MLKPDAVQRGLVGEIIQRFEKRGFKLVALKLVTPSLEHAQKHYYDLAERPFFPTLCSFLSSGPVCAMVFEGEDVIRQGSVASPPLLAPITLVAVQRRTPPLLTPVLSFFLASSFALTRCVGAK
ncbi:unnamed protein product [Chondrus crispus]|uniref:nucleoside-diphosphate kinase n=1 Tax=Chondrus crispus TaxID=2769 RepID=R7Q1Q5_CHOCR|nr:unnamed protein product [Chondrus crispus]CDF32502.1 unnamed protein product [Chondrus crispus]|eukprot:XP_005712167.1 unnamed protein product [Chondrus crispus]